MERKSHLEIARMQMACGGLAIIDRHTLREALPSNWASAQDALAGGTPMRDMVLALMSEYPKAKWFTTKLAGRPVLGLARTIDSIERRIETLTGYVITEVSPTNAPSSILHQEKREEVVRPDPPDELAGFDLEKTLKTLPHHTCANRASGLEMLEKYWLRYPDAFDGGVYLADERERHEAMVSTLKSTHPEMEF